MLCLRTYRFSSLCDNYIKKFEVTFDGLCLAMMTPHSEIDESETYNMKYSLTVFRSRTAKRTRVNMCMLSFLPFE
jgi:hypothetical protein